MSTDFQFYQHHEKLSWNSQSKMYTSSFKIMKSFGLLLWQQDYRIELHPIPDLYSVSLRGYSQIT